MRSDTPPTDTVTRLEAADGRELLTASTVVGETLERPEGTYEVVERIHVAEQDQVDALGEVVDAA